MVLLEHTLIILLLLIALLNSTALHGFRWWLIGAVLALAFLSPTIPVSLPWNWLAAAAIPLILWQTARRLVGARWPERRSDFGLWLGLVIAISIFLLLGNDLALPGAVLFGLLSASMMWRATEETHQPSHLGQLGPLALAFLLAEIAPAVEAPGRYFLALAGGSAVGAATGYVAGYFVQRITAGPQQELFNLAQVYLAYGIAILLGLSGVAAAVSSVVVFVTYGVRNGLWSDGVIRPRPLDRKAVFYVAIAVVAFFSWQIHVPLTRVLVVEIGVALLLTALAVWIGILIKHPAFLVEDSFLRVMRRVGLLFIPAIFLWPRETLLDPAPLVIALAAAGLGSLVTHYLLSPLLRFYTWMDEAIAGLEVSEQIAPTFMVKDLMTTDYSPILPETPVTDVARLVIESSSRCVPVIKSGQLVGVVTEADLFVREEKIPRTDRTFEVLFNEPTLPELLPEVYKKAARYKALDVITDQVPWVKESDSLGSAIRLMVRNGYSCLPVMSASPESGGQLVGMLTRTDIVRLLIKISQESHQEHAE